jgi:hypothetical protein
LIGRRLREGSGVKDSRSGRGKKENGKNLGCVVVVVVVEVLQWLRSKILRQVAEFFATG